MANQAISETTVVSENGLVKDKQKLVFNAFERVRTHSPAKGQYLTCCTPPWFLAGMGSYSLRFFASGLVQSKAVGCKP